MIAAPKHFAVDARLKMSHMPGEAADARCDPNDDSRQTLIHNADDGGSQTTMPEAGHAVDQANPTDARDGVVEAVREFPGLQHSEDGPQESANGQDEQGDDEEDHGRTPTVVHEDRQFAECRHVCEHGNKAHNHARQDKAVHSVHCINHLPIRRGGRVAYKGIRLVRDAAQHIEEAVFLSLTRSQEKPTRKTASLSLYPSTTCPFLVAEFPVATPPCLIECHPAQQRW